MAVRWVELIIGSLEQKKQWRRYKARVDELPEPYRGTAKALERYLIYSGGITDGDTLITMLSDSADLWERAAVDGTPVRDVVGDDPVDFAETFAQAYGGTRWIDKERARLTRAIDDAARPEEDS